MGATLAAAEWVMGGGQRRAFSPAGGLHHAHANRGGGFCVYNDLAVAIRWMQREFGARVLYIDYDAHHGDGVQEIFYDDPEVLTVSFHESGVYLFPGTGFVDELGVGDGYGYSVNIPLAAETEDAHGPGRSAARTPSDHGLGLRVLKDAVPRLPTTLLDKLGRPFTARYLRPEDHPALDTMYGASDPLRAAQGLPPEGDLARRRWLDQVLPLGLQLVVEVDGTLVGHVLLIPFQDDPGTAELANFLHQSVRNRGIGTALNRLVLALAAHVAYRRVWLSVEPSNRAAIRSYERAGFRRLPGSLWAPEIEMAVRLGGAASRTLVDGPGWRLGEQPLGAG